MKRTILFIAISLNACLSAEHRSSEVFSAAVKCQELSKEIYWSNEIDALNHISSLFHEHCYKEMISAAHEAKRQMEHKTFSFTKETAEIFTPEGFVTDYVLESYERGYLSFLIAVSHLKLGNEKDVTPELNKFYNEETAIAYNFGQDPVNAALQAAMWDTHPVEGFSSRPFWQWLTKNENHVDDVIKQFAAHQIVEIDTHAPEKRWQIWEVGRFPTLKWSMNFGSSTNGYVDVSPRKPFMDSCAKNGALLISTKSWLHKIAIRHKSDYHPLVNVKSWIRLPVGLVYGAATITTGAGVMVGGCSLDIGLKGDGRLCGASVYGGVKTMSMAGDVVDYTLQPDLRHWEVLPEAILIAPAEQNIQKGCLERKKDIVTRQIL